MNPIINSGEIDLETARRLFTEMPNAYQLATLHPSYVAADAFRDLRLKPCYWHLQDGNKQFLYCFHMCTVHITDEEQITDIESPYGYGCPLANTNDPVFLRAVNIKFTDWAKSKGILAEFVRLHPLVEKPYRFFDNILFNREVVYVDLRNNLFTEYAGRRRTDIRRAMEKDYVLELVRNAESYAIFMQLYAKTMLEANATAFYFFSGSYFEELAKVPGASCWLLKVDDEYVAGALILASYAARTLEYHLGAYIRRPAFSPLALLLHLLSEHYKKEGFDIFYLGGGRSTDPNDSLLFFKKGFSNRTVDFNLAYRIHDQPRYAGLKIKMKDPESDKILFYRS